VRLHQYVLQQNHHLVAETPRGNCSAFMQSLLTSYTVYFNLRHQRHGHLFDGRFKAKLVEGDAYLLSLSRYVHLNPVRVEELRDVPEEAIERLGSYYWSSYLQYIGRRKRLDFVTCAPTLALMEGAAVDRPRRYPNARSRMTWVFSVLSSAGSSSKRNPIVSRALAAMAGSSSAVMP